MKRLIFSISLLILTLFVTGFAYASPCNCPSAASQSVTTVACPGAEIVTSVTQTSIFTNSHSGWVTVPVEASYVRCRLNS